MAFSGGCLCGQVHYSLEGEPAATAICHCKNCQKQGGGAFSVNLLFSEAQLALNGTLSTFVDKSETGASVYRKFCGTCGSPIYSGLESMPGLVAIKAGTLDDTHDVHPSVQVWCDSKQDWVHLPDDLPGFGKNPPAN